MKLNNICIDIKCEFSIENKCHNKIVILNPIYHGGVDSTPPWFLDSGAFHIDPRGPRFWYNSYFIVTMSVQNVQGLKGVPEKN